VLDVLIAPLQPVSNDLAVLNWVTGKPWWTGRLADLTALPMPADDDLSETAARDLLRHRCSIREARFFEVRGRGFSRAHPPGSRAALPHLAPIV
jgi:hypothetical protein